MLRLSPLVLALLIALGFVTFVIAPLWVQQSWCPPKRPSTGAIQGNSGPTRNENGRHHQEWDFIQFQKVQAETQQEQAAQGDDRWPPTWLCEDVKLTDVLVAYFTFCLVIVGGFTLHQSERSTREVERAYLGGGGECQIDDGQIRRNTAGQRLFRVEIGNHGKTPAFLSAFDIHFCMLSEVRKGPKPVTPRFTHVDQFPAGEKHRPIGDLIPIPRPNDNIVYGAFWYEDIWERPHCYRFILSIDASGRTPSNVTDVDPSYRAWDWKEKKKKKKQT
jgi:hypothetical protein